MEYGLFSTENFDFLSVDANNSKRLRQNKNIHASHSDKCQCLLNAICIGSYIAPHRHHNSKKIEILLAVRGLFAAVLFDERGAISDIVFFGTEKFNSVRAGLKLAPETWHTILAMESNSVIFEVKEGPFDPHEAKEFASWAPPESSDKSFEYYKMLYTKCRKAWNDSLQANSCEV